MKCGRDGSPTQPGHVHADLLAIELWVDGAKRVSDPGVTSYNDDEARRWCRSNAAHNGPYLEGENFPEVWGAFRTGRRCSARLLVLDALDDGALLARAERPCAAGTFRRQLRLEASSLEVQDELVTDRSPPPRWHAPLHPDACYDGVRRTRLHFAPETRS
jgi:hypothetical protein